MSDNENTAEENFLDYLAEHTSLRPTTRAKYYERTKNLPRNKNLFDVDIDEATDILESAYTLEKDSAPLKHYIDWNATQHADTTIHRTTDPDDIPADIQERRQALHEWVDGYTPGQTGEETQ